MPTHVRTEHRAITYNADELRALVVADLERRGITVAADDQLAIDCAHVNTPRVHIPPEDDIWSPSPTSGHTGPRGSALVRRWKLTVTLRQHNTTEEI